MPEPYDLNIDLNVLNHLGLNLYSNVPAVLSEMVANAWDADATRVEILISRRGATTLGVRDNGCGMTDAELREKYLTVGYERRKTGDKTERGRPVMGRKGIGKLSVFSIAGKVQILTKAKGSQPLGIELDVKKIEAAIEKKEVYHPRRISPPQEAERRLGRHGTILLLTNLKKRVNASLDKYVSQRVARRFSIFSENFRVFIDGKEITFGDRNYFENLEYALVYGNYDHSRFKHDPHNVVPRASEVESDVGRFPVQGWIGLAEKSGSLQEGSDNLNKISVLARGKVALEDILDIFREGGMYTKYLIGELEADFLDLTDQDDIATSSRQDFIRSDPRFEGLRNFVERELRFLQTARARLKNETGTETALRLPAVKEWYNTLGPDSRQEVQKLFGRINQIATDESHQKTLYKHGILAFEHLRHKDKLKELERLDINNLEVAVQLFSDLDDIEASWYHQITEGRLDVIRKFDEHVTEDVLEKIIQEHIYNHLWILDPSWERATEMPTMEQSVTRAFRKISNQLTRDEKRGRVDIRYKKTSGKHVIIELKRASAIVSDSDLMKQMGKYTRALRKQLQEANENGPIDGICLVGRPLSEWTDKEERQRSERALAEKGIKVITYRQLMKDAQASYRGYLEREGDKGQIKRLLDAIEES